MGSFHASRKPHAVCIPLPFQGHIYAMLKLAKLLHFRGFHITVVNTEFNHQKLLRARGPDSVRGLPDFQFETIPDGLPPCDIDSTQGIYELCEAVKVNMLVPFRNLITKLNEISVVSERTPRVSCILSDACMTSPLVVAKELGIPGVLLWPMSAAFYIINLYCGELVEKGVIPLKDNSDLETHIDFIPGLRDVRIKDLPPFFLTEANPQDNIIADQLQGVSKASAIIINTFDALESEVLEAIKPLLPPIYTIGPMHLLPQEKSNQLNSLGPNLWKEDAESLIWLDSKQPDSVVYVNFGSLVVLTKDQLIEFAWGLANSGHPFLWVIRPGLLTGNAAVLPPEFIAETADRGIIISGWCPQEQVLNHSAIRGFLTHSGWNSTMDTICAGVPFISWPFLGDQQINCRCSCSHWGIGMEIDHDVKRDVVERLVREMMEGEKGKNMKKRVIEWKKTAEESTKPGGSSYINFDKIVLEVLVQNKLD